MDVQEAGWGECDGFPEVFAYPFNVFCFGNGNAMECAGAITGSDDSQ